MNTNLEPQNSAATADPATAEAQAAKDRRAEQARINGAHGKGPTSPEGKAISSKNSLKHGFCAKTNLLIDSDDQTDFDAHLAGYLDSLRPTNYYERELVEEIAALNWRKSRLLGIDSALIDFQLTVQEHKVDQYFPLEAGNPRLHLALAWQGIARSPFPRQLPADPNVAPDPTQPPDGLDIQSFDLLRRYLGALDRQAKNAQNNLANTHNPALSTRAQGFTVLPYSDKLATKT